MWRRSEVMTDLEFYELRYSGKAAGVVRGFRSVYLGFLFNCIIMATVNLAGLQDRRDPVRPGSLADTPAHRPPQRRLRHLHRALGGPGHRHDPVFHQDDGRHRRRLFRHPRRRRPGRHAGQAFGHERAERRPLPQHSPRLQEQLGPGHRHLHHAPGRPMVGGLVPRGRAGRRQLHRPADAGHRSPRRTRSARSSSSTSPTTSSAPGRGS